MNTSIIHLIIFNDYYSFQLNVYMDFCVVFYSFLFDLFKMDGWMDK